MDPAMNDSLDEHQYTILRQRAAPYLDDAVLALYIIPFDAYLIF